MPLQCFNRLKKIQWQQHTNDNKWSIRKKYELVYCLLLDAKEKLRYIFIIERNINKSASNSIFKSSQMVLFIICNIQSISTVIAWTITVNELVAVVLHRPVQAKARQTLQEDPTGYKSIQFPILMNSNDIKLSSISIDLPLSTIKPPTGAELLSRKDISGNSVDTQHY